MLIRFLIIGLLSSTAASIFAYQGYEVVHVLLDYFKKN